MDQKLRNYAPYGLLLSGISIIFSAAYYFVIRKFDIPLQLGLAFVIVGIALFAVFDPEKVRSFFTGRQLKYGSNFVIFSIAVLGILVVTNFLVNKYSTKWDLTEDQDNTLAPETIAALKSLPEKVNALAFFSPQYPKDQANSLLSNLKSNSAGNFDYQFIDPVADPITANKFSITTDGTIVLLLKNQIEQVKLVSEEEIVTSIIKLINPTKHAIYFLTGHGEHDPNGTDDTSYSQVKTVLESKNYLVATLNLAANPQIPADAEEIIIAGPIKPLTVEEVNLLKQFVDSGKSLLILEDPIPLTQFGNTPDPLAEYANNTWGILLANDFVIDGNSQSPSQAVANEYGDHPIVKKLAGLITIFPSSRSVVASQTPPENIQLTTLVWTADQAWGETDFAGLQQNQVKYDDGVDSSGPVPLAVAGINSSTNGRIVVIGNSNFAITKNYTAFGNGDFIINSIDWAAQQDKLINLTPKKTTQRVLVPPQNIVMNLLVLGSVFLMPGLILIAGIIVWVQRKKRG
jgi:ABC-type uncharacterized transport system involved in gliding motility auxiliary subunit